MSRLLDRLARQVDAFFAGNEPDWAIVESILQYNLGYPDVVHHPKEELVLERLKVRDPEAARIIGELDVEHESLSAEARRFYAAVRGIRADPALPRDWFAGLANDYIDQQRRHMQMEEVILFPIAKRTLHAKDWAEIEAAFARSGDPLLESGVGERFDSLREAIIRTSAPAPAPKRPAPAAQ